MSAQQKRRRDVLFVLLGLVGVHVLPRRPARARCRSSLLQLVADVALAGYVYLLLQYKQRAQEQRSKVRYLGARVPRAGAVHERPVPRRRSSDSSGPRLVPLRQTASN